MLELYPAARIVEGSFPAESMQVIATKSIRTQLHKQLGDSITLDTPDGALTFTICGFTGDTSMLTEQDAFGLFMNIDTYRLCFPMPKAPAAMSSLYSLRRSAASSM